MSRLAAAIVLAWVAAAVAGWWFEVPPVDLPRALLPPGPGGWLGTDPLGRPLDVLVLLGARTALTVGLASVAISAAIGTLVGASAAWRGGLWEAVAMRAVDVLLAFPGLILAIAVVAVLGPRTLYVVLALALVGWTGFARLVRGEVLTLRGEAFVEAARTVGVGPLRLLLRHLVPNLLGPLAVQASFAVAGAILAESSLAFLGLGDPSHPSWGGLLSIGVAYLTSAPYLAIPPGAAIFLVVLALNLLGDALADRYGGRDVEP